jgi:hypothetical protein
VLRFKFVIALLLFCCFARAQGPGAEVSEAMKKAGAMSRDEIREEIRKWGGANGFLRESTRGIMAVSPIVVNEFTEILRAEVNDRQQIIYMSLRTLDKRTFLENESAAKTAVRTMLGKSCDIVMNQLLISEFDATFRYIVFSKDREQLFDIVLNKATCKP